jgi:hypothetical protein
VVLLPKSSDVVAIRDYRPIFHIHVLGNLFSKVLMNHLAPQLDEFIHVTHSAFVKDRYIQDNFRCVQTTTKLLHSRRHPLLLLKMDISRSFGSVSLSFLIDVMRHVVFPVAWREWISVLFSSASTRIQLNGTQVERICHSRGLR